MSDYIKKNVSKEQKAFANIKREVGMPYFSALYDIDFWRQDLKTVDYALELLEIIREYFLSLKFDKYLKAGYETIKSQPYSSLELSKENFNKLKDWLENE